MSKLSEAHAALDALATEQRTIDAALQTRNVEITDLAGQLAALRQNPAASSVALATLTQTLTAAKSMHTQALNQAGVIADRIRHQKEWIDDIDIQARKLRNEIVRLEADLSAAERRAGEAVRLRDGEGIRMQRSALGDLQTREAGMVEGADKTLMARDIRQQAASLAGIDRRAAGADQQIVGMRSNTAAFVSERRRVLLELVGPESENT